ncbi:hypothetical protein BMS3Abin05_01456 [bacterium BMS3Abin05]|nr:hypothetical protein BMS3Abin05_01456 [bacterium BMS3Abin05]GBE26483.1 hypothetical protein BMS3Bbin03_00396 [bacterium BMS3Bbin03]HDL78120.1 DUF1385 domain-containing protein [Bacteroidota bacterium]HDZ11193.1 DUF1385 domain-containing protein [Bacteroidota bacterium]
MKEKEALMPVGGQAVIEGVMMRSPHAVSVAVRKPNGKILVHTEPYISWTTRNKFWGLPIVRGGVVLIESLYWGIKTLTFSGDVALEEEDKKNGKQKEPDKKSGFSAWRTALMITVSLAVGLFIFFYAPLMITDRLGVKSGFWFNLVDGGIRLVFFLLYLILIMMIKDIRRIFEYHGAEHKSIFAYESGLPLTPDNARPFTTHHPRCGTSFLLIVMLVSIAVFMFLGRPETLADRLVRLLFVPVIGGISYELIRFSGKGYKSKIGSILVAPGLWLQKITTKEPDESQLEVAFAALEAALHKNTGAQEYVLKGEQA